MLELDLDEMLRSQRVMLVNLQREPPKLEDDQLKASYRQQLKQVGAWLARQPNLETLFVAHRDALDDPARFNRFLGGELDGAAMAGVVDPSP